MNTFLGEIGKRLAERWAALLALPGLLFLATATVGRALGWRDALDLGQFHAQIGVWANDPTLRSIGGIVLIIVVVLVGSVAIGLAAAALGWLLSVAWNLPGYRLPASWAAGLRRRRSRQAKRDADDPGATAEKILTAIARADRISLVEADRPTWIGDRMHACRVRVERAYGLDLDAAWPRLWLLLPDAVRAEIGTARDAYAAAARLMGWALMYLVLTVWWWPAGVIGLATGAIALIKARGSTANLADLVESVIDLYGRELAARLGHSGNGGPLTVSEGEAISTVMRKSRWDPESPLADDRTGGRQR